MLSQITGYCQFFKPSLMHSICGPDSASWSSTAPSVSSVLSSRCLGFMNATASSYKKEVETFLMMVFCLFESFFFFA